MAGHNHPSYKKIYILLLVLFVISVAGPEVADKIFGHDSVSGFVFVLLTAFGIALVKAYYVCAYFMHLKFEKIYAPYLLFSMVAIMFVFFFGVITDSGKASGHNWTKKYEEPAVAAGEHPADDAHGDSDHTDEHGDH